METNPKIYVVGSGAIGKALAVILKRAGKDVIVIRGSLDNGRTEGVDTTVTLADGSSIEAEIEITTLSSFRVLNGIVVLANKSYGNEQLAASLKGKVGLSPIVLLQNGLGIEKHFIAQGFQQIYRCVLFVTSQLITQNEIRFKPVRPCPIGMTNGDEKTLNQIVSALNTPQFQFKTEANLQEIVWKKAIVNIVFNSICPLLDVDNGIFYRNQSALSVARRIIAECTIIANKLTIKLTANDVVDSLLQISQLSDGQLISTLQDIRKARQTEIDTLNFEVLRIAKSLGQQHILQETKLLGELIELKSAISKYSKIN